MRYSLKDQLDSLLKLAEEDLIGEGKSDCGCPSEEECDCDHSDSDEETKPELDGDEAKALSMLAEALRSKEASAEVSYTDLIDYLRGL